MRRHATNAASAAHRRSRLGRWRAASPLLVLLLAACTSVRTSPPCGVGPGRERGVWVALLQQQYIGSTTRVVVLDPALDVEARTWDRPGLASSELWASFVAANSRTRGLPRNLDPGAPVAWFSSEEWRALPKVTDAFEMGWTAFHERFPGNSGLVSLSGVGFSRDGRQALVYGFVGSASLSASGDFFLFQREGGGWRLLRTQNMVVA